MYPSYPVVISCQELIIKYNIIDGGFVQDCSNSTANALELLQSCAKPLNRFKSYKSQQCTESECCLNVKKLSYP